MSIRPAGLAGYALLGLALALGACGGDAPSPTVDSPSGTSAIIATDERRGTNPSGGGGPAAVPSLTSTAPTAVPTSEARGTLAATAAPSPVPPTATPTPASAQLVQLTDGGCCTQPFWSSDSQQVMFIDRPAPDAPTGIYGVPVDAPRSSPALVTAEVARYSAGMRYRIERTSVETAIVEVESGERWTVPADGRRISLSPNRERIAWEVENEDLPPERQSAQIWVSDFDGANAQAIGRVARGGLDGWLSDDELLVTGRESLDAREEVLWAMTVPDGARRELLRTERLRRTDLAPGRARLAYFVAQHTDPAANGLWLIPTDGSASPERLEPFGAFEWRDATRLLVVPFEPGTGAHRLVEIDVETGTITDLTDPEDQAFTIANGDWTVSPDGRHVAFVEHRDRNIWLLTLPGE